MRLWFYLWHSFNWVPNVSLVSVVEDETFEPASRWLQVTWFGIILNVEWPSTTNRRGWSWP